MKITMLDGFGCAECIKDAAAVNYRRRDTVGLPTLQGFGFAFSGAADYDVIVIGGKQYSANAILDKTIVAAKDTKIYSNAKGTTVIGTIKAGNPIGKVYSYINSSSPASDGRSWLMFESSYGQYFYTPNEAVAAPKNTPTLEEELKQEELEKLRETNPMEYYLSKYGTKVLVTAGVVFVGVTFGKEILRHFLSKGKKSEAATI